MRKRILWSLCIVLIVALGAPAMAKDTVKLGTLKLVNGAPIYIALEKGFFDDEGIKIDVQWFTAAAPVTVAVASGAVDVGATGVTAALFNSIEQGSKMYLVADRGAEKTGFPLNAVVVNKAAYQQGVKSLKDLKGKKVGITTLGSTYHYQIGRLLEQEGMELSDVELVPLKTTQLVVDAVRQGTVTAAIVSPPFGADAEVDGWGRRLFWCGDKLPYQVTAVFYSEQMRKNRDLAVRFMRAYLKGVRYYADAALGKQHGKNYDEVINIVAKYTDEQPRVIKQSLLYIDRDGEPDIDDLMAQQKWYLKNQMITKILQPSEFVDLSFARAAAK
jgi:NitT/TauT family transport system substrate-binding protein